MGAVMDTATETATDTATDTVMQLKNSTTAYGWVAIVLHWISAIGVIWLYFLGEDIEHAKEDGLPRAEVVELMSFHSSIGALFFIFLAARIVSHIAQRQPSKPDQHRYLNLLSRAVMWLFLLMIGLQIITGPIIIWTRPAPVEIFDFMSIPSPFPARAEWLHEAAEFVHKYAPNLFWPLIILHVAGALKHQFIDKDGSALRIIRVKKDG